MSNNNTRTPISIDEFIEMLPLDNWSIPIADAIRRNWGDNGVLRQCPLEAVFSMGLDGPVATAVRFGMTHEDAMLIYQASDGNLFTPRHFDVRRKLIAALNLNGS